MDRVAKTGVVCLSVGVCFYPVLFFGVLFYYDESVLPLIGIITTAPLLVGSVIVILRIEELPEEIL